MSLQTTLKKHTFQMSNEYRNLLPYSLSYDVCTPLNYQKSWYVRSHSHMSRRLTQQCRLGGGRQATENSNSKGKPSIVSSGREGVIFDNHRFQRHHGLWTSSLLLASQDDFVTVPIAVVDCHLRPYQDHRPEDDAATQPQRAVKCLTVVT